MGNFNVIFVVLTIVLHWSCQFIGGSSIEEKDIQQSNFKRQSCSPTKGTCTKNEHCCDINNGCLFNICEPCQRLEKPCSNSTQCCSGSICHKEICRPCAFHGSNCGGDLICCPASGHFPFQISSIYLAVNDIGCAGGICRPCLLPEQDCNPEYQDAVNSPQALNGHCCRNSKCIDRKCKQGV